MIFILKSKLRQCFFMIVLFSYPILFLDHEASHNTRFTPKHLGQPILNISTKKRIKIQDSSYLPHFKLSIFAYFILNIFHCTHTNTPAFHYPSIPYLKHKLLVSSQYTVSRFATIANKFLKKINKKTVNAKTMVSASTSVLVKMVPIFLFFYFVLWSKVPIFEV